MNDTKRIRLRPRFVPEIPFPSYSYVPGRFPHPLHDARGHHLGIPPQQTEDPDPRAWRSCRPYLYGIDLFNHGYYWEAHEVWEGLWHACGRKGQTADFLKGLIKLAAAGVKVREGKPQGVRSHATRAEALLRLTARRSETAADRYMGLKSTELIQFARNLAHDADEQTARSPDAVRIVFDFILEPE